jgi:hypothetical protein
MIEIKTLSGESFDLYPDTSITFERINPFFLEEAILISARSYNFSLPLTPKNERLLRNFSNPNSYLRDKPVVDVDVFFVGNLFMLAQMNVYQSPDDSVSVVLTRRYSQFRTEKLLRELEFENFSSVPGDNESLGTYFGLAYPDVPFALPQWYNDDDNRPSIDPIDNNSGSRLKPVNWRNGAQEQYTNKDLLSPMFFLEWVIKESVLQTGNLIATGSFFEMPWIKDKLIFNTTLTNIGEEKNKLAIGLRHNYGPRGFSVFLMHIEDLNNTAQNSRQRGAFANNLLDWYDFTEGTEIYLRIFEMDSSGTFQLNVTFLNYTTTLADTLSPETLANNLAAFISLTLANCVVFGPHFNDMKSISFSVRPTGPNKFDAQGAVEFPAGSFLPNKARINFADFFLYSEIKPQNHLPNLTVGAFLNEIAKGCNLAIYLDDKGEKLRFEHKPEILKSESIDVTPYLIKNYDKEMKDEMNLYLSYKRDSSDVIATETEQIEEANNYLEHKKEPLTETTANFSTLVIREHANRRLAFFLSGQDPYVNVESAFVRMKFGDYENPETFGFRLVKYVAPVLDQGLTGHFVLPCSNEELTPNEMYDIFFKDWYQIVKYSSRWFWFRFAFPVNFFLQFDPAKTWYILNNKYVWHTFKTTLKMDGESETEVKCLKL